MVSSLAITFCQLITVMESERPPLSCTRIPQQYHSSASKSKFSKSSSLFFSQLPSEQGDTEVYIVLCRHRLLLKEGFVGHELPVVYKLLGSGMFLNLYFSNSNFWEKMTLVDSLGMTQR